MRKTRIEKKISLLKLASITGIKTMRLSALEVGRDLPEPDEIKKIACVLGDQIRFPDADEAKKIKVDAVELVLEEIDRCEFNYYNQGSSSMPCPICENSFDFWVDENGPYGRCSIPKCISFETIARHPKYGQDHGD